MAETNERQHRPQVTAASIGVTATRLDVLQNAPHEAALRWRSELGAADASALPRSTPFNLMG
jgi:hypothetical protein